MSGDNVVKLPGAEVRGPVEPPDDGRGRRGGGAPGDGDPGEDCPVIPLGTRDGRYWFMSQLGELREFAWNRLWGRGGLQSLLDGDTRWLWHHFPRFDKDGETVIGFNVDRAATWLVAACRRRGLYDDTAARRGLGLWPLSDGRRVLHVGDAIAVIEGNGEHPLDWMPPGRPIDGTYYVAAPPRTRPAMDLEGRLAPAPPEVGQDLLEAASLWAFRQPAGARLWVGWLANALLGGVGDWHPHIWVQGTTGSGKTWLHRLGTAVLGPAMHPSWNNVTEAFVRKVMNENALALMLDESESDSHPERIRTLIELIRHMSEDEGARGGRGGPEGGSFQISGCVALTAILPEPLRAQDANRITMLSLDDADPRNAEAAEAARTTFAQAAPALRARMIARLSLYHENLKAARDVLVLVGEGPRGRQADQLGALIAGYWTLTGDAPPDEARRAEITDFLPFLVDNTALPGGEAARVLAALFGRFFPQWRSGEQNTLGEVVARARQQAGGEARAAVRRVGLRLVPRRGESDGDAIWSEAWLAVANTHGELAKLMEGTEWDRSRWHAVLQVKPDSPEERARRPDDDRPLRFAGAQSRFALIPPRLLPDPAGDEADDLPR